MAEGELRLWEFEDCGFYAAASKQAAFLLLQAEDGTLTEDDAESAFIREVPPAERVTVVSEDSWEDVHEERREGHWGYALTLPASEWAKRGAQGQGGPGYVFGGRE